METLSNGEEQLVGQFVSITSFPGENYQAFQYLREADWDLERAILLYFENTPEANSSLNANSRSSNVFPGSFPSNNNANGTGTDDEASGGIISLIINKFHKMSNRPVLPYSSQDLNGFFSLNFENQAFYIFQVIIFVPVFSLYKLFAITFALLCKIFPLLSIYSTNRHSSKSDPKGIDPAHIARNFINDFNTFYKNDNRLDFFEGGYTSALYVAKRDARFLVVYLHNDEHDDTNEFVNETLLNDSVLKMFNDHNILIWGGDIHESEAYQVSNSLNVLSFPFLGLLCLKTNSRETPDGTVQSAPTLTCVSRVQSLISPDKLIAKFSQQIEKLEPDLISMRTERQEQELSRVLRQQQDQAYQLSLERDRQLAEQRRQEKIYEENKQAFLKWRLSTLKPEVASNLKNQYSRIAIRLNNGERITRRFDKDSSLEEIYAFVELYQLGLLNETVNEDVTKPEEFQYKYKFKLVSIMPREDISNSEDILIKDSIVWPNGNLIFEEVD